MIFDKTGTITEGKPKVQTLQVFGKRMTENKMLSLAAAAEETSSHPLAIENTWKKIMFPWKKHRKP